MKKIFLPLFIFSILLFSSSSFGQVGAITIGIKGSDCDQLVVQWNSTYNFVGAGQNQWTQSTITISYPLALGNAVLGTITSFMPGFTGWQYDGVATVVGSEYRQRVILLSGAYTQNIPVGITEIIGITLNGTGTASFTISNPNNNTNISHFNHPGEMWSGTFNPSAAANVSLDDKIVWNGTNWCGGTGTNYQPGPGDTKPCSITGLNGHLTQSGATVGTLTIPVGGSLTIDPGASLTASGNTTISQPNGLIIGANATGSGSFIDNNSITYNGSGSSQVQTYLLNTSTAGTFHIHQIGPTVKNPAFSSTYSGETGVFLSAFELQANGTYAYKYAEPTNTWTNFFANTDPVPTACGIILSDVSGVSSTLTMTGQLVTDGVPGFTATPGSAGSLPSWAMTYTAGGGQGNFMAANPYPSGLDLKLYWLDYGTTYLGTAMRVWDEVNGQYATLTRKTTPPTGWLYTLGFVGTSGIINPGQGFFIEAKSTYIGTNGDQVYLVNGYRTHYNGPFIKNEADIMPDLLNLTASTSSTNAKDEIIIYFNEGLSSGLDESDAIKWASMYEEALEIKTVSTDLNELTVNAMPALGDEMVSIPLNFKCGTSGEITFDFSGMDSFESGTEIYLEDMITGGNWINLYNNPVYTFSGNSGDTQERFILHFFGPTGIDDPQAEISAVQIYGFGQDAYIVNRGNETIKEYIAYDMMGREIHSGSLPNSTVNKVQIGDVSAYYIVKVITKEGTVYTDKVYINK